MDADFVLPQTSFQFLCLPFPWDPTADNPHPLHFLEMMMPLQMCEYEDLVTKL